MHLLKTRTLLFKAANLSHNSEDIVLNQTSKQRHLQNWMTRVLAQQNFTHEPITNTLHHHTQTTGPRTPAIRPQNTAWLPHAAQDAEMLTMRRPLINCNALLLMQRENSRSAAKLDQEQHRQTSKETKKRKAGVGLWLQI